MNLNAKYNIRIYNYMMHWDINALLQNYHIDGCAVTTKMDARPLENFTRYVVTVEHSNLHNIRVFPCSIYVDKKIWLR